MSAVRLAGLMSAVLLACIFAAPAHASNFEDVQAKLRALDSYRIVTKSGVTTVVREYRAGVGQRNAVYRYGKLFHKQYITPEGVSYMVRPSVGRCYQRGREPFWLPDVDLWSVFKKELFNPAFPGVVSTGSETTSTAVIVFARSTENGVRASIVIGRNSGKVKRIKFLSGTAKRTGTSSAIQVRFFASPTNPVTLPSNATFCD